MSSREIPLQVRCCIVVAQARTDVVNTTFSRKKWLAGKYPPGERRGGTYGRFANALSCFPSSGAGMAGADKDSHTVLWPHQN